jgi:predicted transcriptional regulator
MMEADQGRPHSGSEVKKILENLYDFSEIDQKCFALVESSPEPLKIDDLKEELGKDRSTVYRSVQRLVEHGFVSKEKINFDRGGYCHVYRCRDRSELASRMNQKLNDRHTSLKKRIESFRDQ